MQNGTREVSIKGSAGQAEFSGGRYNGSLESYISRLVGEFTGQQLHPARIQRTMINGIPAALTTLSARSRSGIVDASIVAYQWEPGTVYHFVLLSAGGSGIGPFWPMVQSIRKLSPAERAQIRPRVIDVITVAQGDTVQSLASRMAYRDFKVERFLALNGLAPTSVLRPGQTVKLVVHGVRRT
jgi:predicted Zn-dependent protease